MPLLGQSPMSAAIENMAAKTELGMFRAKAREGEFQPIISRCSK
jgi:hypothetical protein